MKKYSKEHYELIAKQSLTRQYAKIQAKAIEEFIPTKEDKTPFKCCRLKYLHPAWKIANVFIVHGDDIELWDNSFPQMVDDDTGEVRPAEPKHGWLMKKKDEGYPCDALTPTGCKFEGENKPWRCRKHPTTPLELIKTCSYMFDKDGNRSGECNQCEG